MCVCVLPAILTTRKLTLSCFGWGWVGITFMLTWDELDPYKCLMWHHGGFKLGWVGKSCSRWRADETELPWRCVVLHSALILASSNNFQHALDATLLPSSSNFQRGVKIVATRNAILIAKRRSQEQLLVKCTHAGVDGDIAASFSCWYRDSDMICVYNGFWVWK